MPAENSLPGRWLEANLVFQKNLELLKQRVDQVAIHDLRVSVKKLRSYLRLFIASGGDKELGAFFQSTRDLFSALGKLRNIAITRDMLPKLHFRATRSRESLFVYLQLLEDQAAVFSVNAVRSYKPAGLRKLSGRLKKEMGQVDAGRILKITQSEIKKAIRRVARNLKHFNDKSHLIRKLLKDLSYWEEIYAGEAIIDKKARLSIERILAGLGEIQDLQIAIFSFKTFRSIMLSRGMPENKPVKILVEKAEKQRDRLLARTCGLTEKLVREI